tara:strand:+ start:101 stop:961 length:861 start_codon:yes stop_codon:yes gene_type:complete
MASKNPFLVLGLNPSLVKSLSNENLQRILKSNYRNLQMIYHPDKFNGSDKKSKELSEAYEILSSADNQVFDYFKNKLTKKGKNKQEKEIEELEQKNKILSKSITNYFNGLTNESNVFNSGPCKLLMYDYAKAVNFSMFNRMKQSSKEELSYNLIIDKNNNLFRKEGRNRIALKDKTLIGCISDETAVGNRGIKSILRKAVEIYTGDDKKINFARIRGERFSGKVDNVETRIYENKINPENFKEIFPLLTPEMSKYSYLFSINRDEDGGNFYSIDGRIREIKKTSKK